MIVDQPSVAGEGWAMSSHSRSIAADHAYRTLKAALLCGRFVPGSIINVHALALEMGLSISPIRDVLGRLVGERIVQQRMEGGFQVPAVTEEGAADLYRWNMRLLQWAVRDWHAAGPGASVGEIALVTGDDISVDNIVTETSSLFRAIAASATSPELRHAIEAVDDRLAPMRVREVMLDDRVTELRGLVEAAGVGDGSKLHRALVRYHQRRLRRVAALVAALYTPPR
jgi:DNA-binding GntR family transcriptional regulator